MTRLADRIAERGLGINGVFGGVDYSEADWEASDLLAEWISVSRTIVADNVRRYWSAEHCRGEHLDEAEIGAEFPCVAPPFPRLFIEWADDADFGDGMRRTMSGVHVESFKRTATDTMKGEAGEFAIARSISLLADCKWLLYMQAVAERVDREIDRLPLHLVVQVDGEGQWLKQDLMRKPSPAPLDPLADAGSLKAAMGFLWFYPALLTLSFMNCRNVKAVEVVPPPKLSKAHQKRRGRPLVRYHVLEIEPVRRILDPERVPGVDGLTKAMHICRGHFKDYRAAGLFGKVKGVFWWDHHVRGSVAAGQVIKDYAIGPSADGGGR